MQLFKEQQRVASLAPEEKKELKLSLSCSVALLDKDYAKLVSMVKTLRDKEELLVKPPQLDNQLAKSISLT